MKRLSMMAAVVLVVLMVHAMGVSAVSVSPLVSCEPGCATTDTGGKVVNPENCTEFYYCKDGKPLGPISCPEDNHFDTTTNACKAGNVCENVCDSTSYTCKLKCTDSLEMIGDPTDCSVYYVCTAGQAIPLGCPTDRPHFDEKTQSCVNDESVCCSYCVPYCDGTGFSLVPDPDDCTRFFICDSIEGKPGDGYHMSCDGGYFSVKLGDCVSGTPPNPCPTLCGSTGGGSSTTTITTTTSSSTTTTTTSPSSSTTTTTTNPGGGATDINGCVSSLVCTDEGYFPACSTCQREYFRCSGEGALGVMSSCPGDTVFNPTSGYGYCILPSNCPYQ